MRQSSKPRDNGSSDERLEVVLARARALAEGRLEGINEAALELAALAGGDRTVIERARRQVNLEVDRQPTTHAKQMASLIRRSLELGEWEWRPEESSRPLDFFGEQEAR
jgi:hypothetical protein